MAYFSSSPPTTFNEIWSICTSVKKICVVTKLSQKGQLASALHGEVTALREGGVSAREPKPVGSIRM